VSICATAGGPQALFMFSTVILLTLCRVTKRLRAWQSPGCQLCYFSWTADFAKWPSHVIVGGFTVWKHGVTQFAVCSWKLHVRLQRSIPACLKVLGPILTQTNAHTSMKSWRCMQQPTLPSPRRGFACHKGLTEQGLSHNLHSSSQFCSQAGVMCWKTYRYAQSAAV
jgi:hypothetical protein